jgi:hypothetical protein
MKMNKATTERIRARAAALLEPLETEFGVKVAAKRGSYGTGHCALTFEFAEVTDGITQTREAEAFKTLAGMYGLKADDLGRKFVYNGDTFKLVGISPQSRKYPLLAERCRDGKGMKFTERIAKVLI